MNSEERVKDISRYLGIIDYPCRKCGAVNIVEEVDVEVIAGKKGNPIFRALCPDCGAFIRRMRNTKAEKIYWKGSTHEIAKLDTSLLIWMLQVGYVKNERVIDEIRKHLKGRIVTNKTKEPMSMSEQREITMKKEVRGLKTRLTELENDKAKEHHAMLVNAATWNAMEMGAFLKRATALTKIIDDIKTDIHKKEEMLEI